MLYLKSADADGTPCAKPVPVAELTATGLERALLAADLESRRSELHAALTRDPAVADWVTAQFHFKSGDKLAALDDAANWLASHLELELAKSFVAIDGANSRNEIETRLPALARRLAQYERELSEANVRLEREKLESLKELAYGASHEINNPLANIAARAQTLLEEEDNLERQRKLAAIHKQAMRAHEMIADLMLFARPPKLVVTDCNVAEVVRRVTDELRELADQQDTALSCDLSDASLRVKADATQLAVALAALVKNSLEAIGEGGHVCIEVRPSNSANTNGAEIAVRDDGPGISDEVRPHLFDPFFSGREAGRGLGFGLSKSWRIITDHGGEVVVRQPRAGGAEIAIRLPLFSAD